ncbi:TSUP family transporter [Suttonella sp. R2A3]|uniref:TSUP family transporter n=1 Tax=Suttonella sp. R2A3 TaxID=2908648 RepID=UPI001F1E2813|nr:TSUP family transporter [Suttonella sp. R2A3]UJF24775.1 TSUP family transporter [Suttonella sp. R2A3]
MSYELILILLLLTGIFAGFVDTIAGGGGMITLPALLMSGLPPDAALATNKLQGSFGTVSASVYFIRRGELDWRKILPGLIATIIGAGAGTLTVQFLPNQWLQTVIPILLLVVAFIFLFMPSVGEFDRDARMALPLFAVSAALPIGFYDGFLGPGTGSFFLLALITLRGKNLRNATIEAKAYNAATNVTSLVLFMIGGSIVWLSGLAMAAGQLVGARIASNLIIDKGNALIRPMVIIVSIIMSAILAYRYWL